MQKWMLNLVLTITCLGMFSATSYSQEAEGYHRNPFRRVGSWWKEMRSQFELDYRRNNAWPQPFAAQDQLAVKSTFMPMYIEGARLGRVLDSVHFDPKTHELNNAGKTHLREILEQRRPLDILISSTMDPKIDQQRRETLKGLLAGYKFVGQQPGVSTTFYLPHHKPATERAELRQKYFNSSPVPALESVSGQISGSSGQ